MANYSEKSEKNICYTWVQTKVDMLLHFVEKLILKGVSTHKPWVHLLYILLENLLT